MEDVSENIIEMTKQISEVKLEGKYVRLNSRVLENWTVESHFGNVKLNTEFSGRSVEILEEYLFRIGQGISDFNTWKMLQLYFFFFILDVTTLDSVIV